MHVLKTKKACTATQNSAGQSSPTQYTVHSMEILTSHPNASTGISCAAQIYTVFQRIEAIWAKIWRTLGFLRTTERLCCVPPLTVTDLNNASTENHMVLDLQSLFGLLCIAVLIGWDPATPPPPAPRIWAHIRGRYWSAKVDDISLCNPLTVKFQFSSDIAHTVFSLLF